MKARKGLWDMPRKGTRAGFVVPYKATFRRIEDGRQVTYYNAHAAIEQPDAERVYYDLGTAESIVFGSVPVESKCVMGSTWP